MTAIEFVKKFGWDVAKKILKDQNEGSFFWCNYCGNGGNQDDLFVIDTHESTFEYCNNCNSDNTSRYKNQFNNLKQIVEAFEVVESYGGYDLAKEVKNITPLRKASYDLIENLKQAIELVEKCQ